MNDKNVNIIVKFGQSGVAVEDVQRRLNKLGFLKGSQIDCSFKEQTSKALIEFCESVNIEPFGEVTDKIWAKLVDATFNLGDRNLYLSMPYFHGNDVLELQKALSSLGFCINSCDGIFGTSTEKALREFQVNMGLPTDGIAGSQTFKVLKNLEFSWRGKSPIDFKSNDKNVFWRASDVLEKNSICLFGTNDFTRDVALRMSNLARATNPFSKVLCSSMYSIAPSNETMLLHLVLAGQEVESDAKSPRVKYSEDFSQRYLQDYQDDIDNTKGLDKSNDNNQENEDLKGTDGFIARLLSAIVIAKSNKPPRITIELPSKRWYKAGEDRSAQHYAITVLDSLCAALERFKDK